MANTLYYLTCKSWLGSVEQAYLGVKLHFTTTDVFP